MSEEGVSLEKLGVSGKSPFRQSWGKIILDSDWL